MKTKKRILLFKQLHYITLLICIASLAWGDSSETQKDDPNKLTFTDKIKTLRSVSGEYDVFFNEHYGPYSVPYSLPNSKNKDLSPEEQLRAFYKHGSSITVTVNPITETLISIDSDTSRAPSSKNSNSEDDLPPELKDYEDIIKNYSKPKN